jgi:H+/Cl- antiporter ClcA
MSAKRTQTFAVALIGLGALLAGVYYIEPFQVLFQAFSSLPGPLQVALGLVLVGMAVLVISLLIERWSDLEEDASLNDNPPQP